jgi:hypothetical protein
MKCTFRWLAIAAVTASSLLANNLLSSPAQAEEGLYANVDFLFLSPKLNAVGFNKIFYFDSQEIQSAEGSLGSELQFSQRVTVGYEGDQGGGAQVRWFSFDNGDGSAYAGIGEDSVNGSIAINGLVNIDVDSIDAELTQRGKFRVWDWLATAGVRYARVDIHDQAIGGMDWSGFGDQVWFGSPGMQFEGAGPTVSVQGSREVIWEGFELFANGRTALLYGETEIESIFRGGGSHVIEDVFAQVWEVQAGARMVHEHDAFDFVWGLFWEAQRWDNDTDIGNFALHGFGAKAGFQY